ncbi:MAG TPA: glycosyltransferase family 39 protein, partial [Anaerolineales bacterium]|nr:glycosyltransferase family 39 protein [Anaerolineales bacterium]
MSSPTKRSWYYDALFLLVLVLAGYLRLTGVNWGEGQHQHPDENFFSQVTDNLRAKVCVDPAISVDVCPADQRRWIGIGEYLDTSVSPLNPYTRGFSFYVYGNLPLTIVRIAADATDEVNLRLFGRQFSALADLFAILFLYFIVSRLYGQRVGLLASLFSALAVMQIQQAHFFTVDLFVNTFALLTLWFAVAILGYRERKPVRAEVQEDVYETMDSEPEPPSQRTQTSNIPGLIRHPLFLYSVGFGVALGMAMASKINIALLAIALPAALVLRYLVQRREDNQPLFANWSWDNQHWTLVMVCLVAGGLATGLSFRFFQPYAFDGIGFNPQWVANIREQRVQATGGADLPWELQWARRTHLFSFTNLTVWGLGLPLGILAWAGFLYMGWRILKGELHHLLLWGWTAAYFLWQSLQFNPTMRYQLPIYPLLAMMAAWFIFELAGLNRRAQQQPALTAEDVSKRSNIRTVLASILGVTVLALTAIWAFAFHSIYLRDEPRMAASRWIYQNVPGPINVQIQNGDWTYNQPLPFPVDGFIQTGQPYDTSFTAKKTGILESITLGHATNKLASSSTLNLTISDTPNPPDGQALATASLTSDFAQQSDGQGDSYTLKLNKPVSLQEGVPYYLRLEIDEGVLEIGGAAVANETDYDYALPFRVDGYDAFGGIYRGDLTLQVYWDDNAEKLTRYVDVLSQADYILIPTNHQYGQITRLPERYPLTTLYYRELIGCPNDKDIIWCYYVAKPGQFKGRLGYD